MTVGVYILTNKINDKVYIGQSWNIEKRLDVHSRASHQVISRAINRYGWENFDIQIVPTFGDVDQNELNLLECYHIDFNNSLFPNGYNMKEGGNNGKLNEKTKQKIAESKTGIPRSQETKQKISKALKGKPAHNKGKPGPNKGIPRSQETKQKLRDAHLGKKFSEEHRRNLSIAKKGKKCHTLESRQKLALARKGKPGHNKNKRWRVNPINNRREYYICVT